MQQGLVTARQVLWKDIVPAFQPPRTFLAASCLGSWTRHVIGRPVHGRPCQKGDVLQTPSCQLLHPW